MWRHFSIESRVLRGSKGEGHGIKAGEKSSYWRRTIPWPRTLSVTIARYSIQFFLMHEKWRHFLRLSRPRGLKKLASYYRRDLKSDRLKSRNNWNPDFLMVTFQMVPISNGQALVISKAIILTIRKPDLRSRPFATQPLMDHPWTRSDFRSPLSFSATFCIFNRLHSLSIRKLRKARSKNLNHKNFVTKKCETNRSTVAQMAERQITTQPRVRISALDPMRSRFKYKT